VTALSENPAPARAEVGREHDDHEPPAGEHEPIGHPNGGPIHWGYDGPIGPSQWATLDPAYATCETGKTQSPIDIVPHAESPDAPLVAFHYKATSAEIVDNGHTLQVSLGRGSYATVDGKRYDLVQFHVHTPSEHTVGGESLPMEVHLVHKTEAGKLAVVGVMFAAGAPSEAMAPVWSSAPRLEGLARKLRKFDPTELLPRDHSAYRYDGSLTTPPCSEGVEWIVLRRTRTDSANRIGAFRTRFGANARPAQLLLARAVE